MTRRAMFWCGHARAGDMADLYTSTNDIELALRAATALGVTPSEIDLFVCGEVAVRLRHRLRVHPARVEALEQVVARIAALATSGDALLFLATNHGLPAGLHAEPGDVDELSDPGRGAPEAVLPPERLAGILDALPGQQVLVIGACHAGAYLSIARTARRAVYAACASGSTIKYLRDPERTPFLARMLGEWTGVSHAAEPSAPSASSLDIAWAAVQREVFPGRGDDPVRALMAGSALWP